MPFQLLQLAEKERITVEYWDFEEPLEAVYWNKNGQASIGLSKTLLRNRAHHRTLLAEELGHHFTSGGNGVTIKCYYWNRINICREEYRAMKWAAMRLIPEDKLYIALQKNIHESWMLADYFNVDESLVDFRLALLKSESIGRC